MQCPSNVFRKLDPGSSYDCPRVKTASVDVGSVRNVPDKNFTIRWIWPILLDTLVSVAFCADHGHYGFLRWFGSVQL